MFTEVYPVTDLEYWHSYIDVNRPSLGGTVPLFSYDVPLFLFYIILSIVVNVSNARIF